MSSSGSVEPVPSRVTVAPPLTSWSAPASATGVPLTVMSTVSVSVPPRPSVDGELEGQRRRPARGGERRLAVVAPVRVTAGAAGLDPARRSSVVAVGVGGAGAVEGDAWSPASTAWSGPASADRRAVEVDVTVSVSVRPSPSVTVSSKVSVAGPVGAVNVGVRRVGPGQRHGRAGRSAPSCRPGRRRPGRRSRCRRG